MQSSNVFLTLNSKLISQTKCLICLNVREIRVETENLFLLLSKTAYEDFLRSPGCEFISMSIVYVLINT